MRKDRAAEPVYAEWFRRLEAGDGWHRLAAWLNGVGVPTRSPIAGHPDAGPESQQPDPSPLPELRERQDELTRRIRGQKRT